MRSSSRDCQATGNSRPASENCLIVSRKRCRSTAVSKVGSRGCERRRHWQPPAATAPSVGPERIARRGPARIGRSRRSGPGASCHGPPRSGSRRPGPPRRTEPRAWITRARYGRSRREPAQVRGAAASSNRPRNASRATVVRTSVIEDCASCRRAGLRPTVISFVAITVLAGPAACVSASLVSYTGCSAHYRPSDTRSSL